MVSPEASTRIVQLKVRLLGLSPMIWRRVLVPESATLRELHGILQVGMGWDGIYLYDMGDYWEHEVRIEQFLDHNSKKTYPVCTGGSGACPPEDCGGPPGYREWQEEATGYDAWSDLDLVVGFVSGVLEGQSAGSLSEDEREDIEAALERMARRQPFLQTTFYRRPVNDAFRAGRHLEMMRRQLI